MNNKFFTTYRFVKNEDLNHHGTLFAGRAAEWFVETGLMATAQHVPAENIVLINIEQMTFKSPIHLGDLIECKACLAHAGKSSFITYIAFHVADKLIVEGFISYVNVDEKGKKLAHNIELNLADEGLKELNLRAQKFLKR
ncbi:acyl-CoA thioesterase [Peptoniphilaceae bacterium SGI.131]